MGMYTTNTNVTETGYTCTCLHNTDCACDKVCFIWVEIMLTGFHLQSWQVRLTWYNNLNVANTLLQRKIHKSWPETGSHPSYLGHAWGFHPYDVQSRHLYIWGGFVCTLLLTKCTILFTHLSNHWVQSYFYNVLSFETWKGSNLQSYLRK